LSPRKDIRTQISGRRGRSDSGSAFCPERGLENTVLGPLGGSAAFLRYWFIPDPFYFVLNLISFFFSPNKGLFVYCPVLLSIIVCIARPLRSQLPLLVFALLSVAGLALGFSLLRDWGDETWDLDICIPASLP
jgi:hypothetical protein